MDKSKRFVLWLEELNKDDVYVAGKKCCNLGEMRQAGLPVPPGFVLSLEAYKKFMKDSGAEDAIVDYLNNNKEKLEKDLSMFNDASDYINKLIADKEVPAELTEMIHEYYEKLCEDCKIPNVPLAVRSSGPVSMPGQFDTFLNIRGKDEVVKRIVQVWGSSFNARAMAYRLQRGVPVESSPIGVAAIKMVNAKSSGVMFTIDPLNGDRSRIFIEGSWGLGESLVSGQVTPDKYILDKVTMEVSKKTICSKVMELIYGPEGDVIPMDISEDRRDAPCLNDEELLQLAKYGKLIEKHYGVPQDIEWAVDCDLPFPDNIILLQTRPETIWSKKVSTPVLQSKGTATEIIARQLMQGIRF
ncbi:MAG: PEP/pyruvate-binding domain-containing protein [Bacillota bacterium]|nr:PEP/pyruvate-binding domain-containing protein [Bacillota bacterium]